MRRQQSNSEKAPIRVFIGVSINPIRFWFIIALLWFGPRFAAASVIPQTGWTLKYADSEALSAYAATNAFDGNANTMWHTAWSVGSPGYPHEIQINLGQLYDIEKFRYLPRQDGGANGRIAQFEFYVSEDGTNWGSPVATGVFANSKVEKEVSCAAKTGQYIRLVALSEVNGNPWTSMAEINVLGSVFPSPGTPLSRLPQNEATGVSTALNLIWPASPNTASYDVYFGTSSPPPKVGNTASTSYPWPDLNNNTLYYWQIVSRGADGGSVVGPIWSFTTADYNHWFNIGPEGGDVQALAINPLAPDTLYIGTYGGVFKSTDGGANWTAMNTGLTGRDVHALTIDPQTPDTIYAGTWRAGGWVGGVFKSTDGGASWSAMNAGLTSTAVTGFAINPQTPETLYAGTLTDGMFKSTDGGMSWTAINIGLTSTYVTSLAINPQTPEMIYAGTGGGVFKSTDGGASWSAMNAGIPIASPSVHSLAINPQAPDTLYAGICSGTNQCGKFKSTDGGASWAAINIGLINSNVRVFALNPVTPNILYAGTEYAGPSENGFVFKSIDAGANWTVMNSGLTNTDIQTLAINPLAPETIYAGNRSGLFKSITGGASWTNTNLSAARVSTLAINAQTPQILYVGSNGGGVIKSADGGASWTAVNTGLNSVIVEALGINPLSPETLHAGTEGGVFKSTDGGASWTGRIYWGSTGTALAIDPQTPETIYAGTSGDGVFKSIDGGANWKNVMASLGSIRVQDLVIDPQATETIYALNRSSGVFKSTDGGANWTAMNTGLPSNRNAYALAIDPQTPQILYLGRANYGGVYKSTDGGGSWTAIGLDSITVCALAINPLEPQILYAGTYGDGVFKSSDGGASWTAMNDGLSNTYIYALAINPQMPDTLYAGTVGGGVFKIQQRNCSGPLIDTHPQSQTILSGQTTSLSVSASGTEPLSYQWYRGASGNTSSPVNGAILSSYTIAGLTQTTSYWVRASNSCGYADSYTATISVTSDTQAPIISNAQVTNITQTTAQISWELDENGNGQVEYGTTAAYGSFSNLEPSFSFKSHSQTLSNLTPGTLYHFRVKSADVYGNLARVYHPRDAKIHFDQY